MIVSTNVRLSKDKFLRQKIKWTTYNISVDNTENHTYNTNDKRKIIYLLVVYIYFNINTFLQYICDFNSMVYRRYR